MRIDRCEHAGESISTFEFKCCGGRINKVDIRECSIHGKCTSARSSWNLLRSKNIRVKCCDNCRNYSELK